MKKQITKLLLLLLFYNNLLHSLEKGIICVPVADLVGEPLTNNRHATYETLPECPTKNSLACPRIHQALFNEMVTILEERGTEVQIKIHNCFFTTQNSHTKHATYWTKKENILPFSKLQKQNLVVQEVIPEPIDYSDKTNHGLYNESIIGLQQPFYSKTLRMHFSAGTRFLLAKNQSNKGSHWLVETINPKTLRATTLSIPKDFTVRQQKKASHEEKLALFIDILNSWSNQKQDVVPYIWGGCSMTKPIKGKFAHKNDISDGYFTYPKNPKNPKSGFDCAGLILRAAQLAGLPYFYKNTTTIAQHITKIDDTDIHTGDIIWIAGHVMVVGDIKKNTLIEARGYEHGYGKIQSIALERVFKDIQNYQVLADQYVKHAPLVRIDDSGAVRNTFANYVILRIE